MFTNLQIGSKAPGQANLALLPNTYNLYRVSSNIDNSLVCWTSRCGDPDSTGGFYQPVTAELPGQLAVLGGVRLDCGLANAARSQVIEYNRRHRINENPRVDRLESQEAGVWAEVGANAPRRASHGGDGRSDEPG